MPAAGFRYLRAMDRVGSEPARVESREPLHGEPEACTETAHRQCPLGRIRKESRGRIQGRDLHGDPRAGQLGKGRRTVSIVTVCECASHQTNTRGWIPCLHDFLRGY